MAEFEKIWDQGTPFPCTNAEIWDQARLPDVETGDQGTPSHLLNTEIWDQGTLSQPAENPTRQDREGHEFTRAAKPPKYNWPFRACGALSWHRRTLPQSLSAPRNA